MVQFDKDLLTWLKTKFYTITQIDTLLTNKSDTNHTHTIDNETSTTSTNPLQNNVITTELNNKAPINHKSTTTDYGIADSSNYGHVKLDTSINSNGSNPVTGGIIYTKLAGKSDTSHTHTSLSYNTISSNDDLNDYNTSGEYVCTTNTIAKTLSNCPVTVAFHLSIIKHAGVRQILKTYTVNSVLTYERNYYQSWGSWKLVYSEDSLSTASNSSNGLMSSTDYSKLSKIDDEANKTTVDTSITSSSTNPVTSKAIYTSLSGKAPTSHASTATTYGLGTTSNYGHVKTINNLTTSSYSDGLALSAYQGKVLKDDLDTKASGTHTHTGTELRLGESGDDANTTIQEAVNNKAPINHASTANTYGLGTTSNYGHVKTVNSLTTSTHTDGLALSAYQGKVLNDTLSSKAPTNHASTATTYGVSTASNYGHSMASSTTPKDISTSASLGSETGKFARGDHVHKHPTGTSKTGYPQDNIKTTFGGSFVITSFTSNETGHIIGAADRTIEIPADQATTSDDGLMSAYDKIKIDTIPINASKTYSLDVQTTSTYSSTNDSLNLSISKGANLYIHLHDTYGNSITPSRDNITGVAIYINGTVYAKSFSGNVATIPINLATGLYIGQVYLMGSYGNIASSIFRVYVEG